MNDIQQAFKQQLIAMLPRLRRYCYALTNDPHQVEDLLQASVERALVKWHQYEVGTHFDRWIYRLCRNLWIDTMRKMQPIEELDEEQIELDTPTIEEALQSSNLLAQVKDRMTELNEGLRVVLYLVAFEGRSYQETADILNIPTGTVMSRLARARQRLLESIQ